MEDVLSMPGGLELDGLYLLSNPNHSLILAGEGKDKQGYYVMM